MSLIIKTVTSIMITLFVSMGVSDMAEATPQEAADDFFAGLSSGDDQVMALYMDNEYVNFLENVKGTDEDMDRLTSSLFQNFSYKIIDTAVRGDVAVCKVEVSNSDFSNLLKDYEKASYKYIMTNLYDEKVTDKEQLNKKCLDIYLNQIEKTSSKDPSYAQEIFLPMEGDGYGGWHIVLSDEIMQTILGGLQIPESADGSDADKGGDE